MNGGWEVGVGGIIIPGQYDYLLIIENGRLIDADNLKQHFNIRLDRDAFSKENKLVNKLIRQRSISIEENEASQLVDLLTSIT